MKKIVVGVNDFKELIERNIYYFDKTKYIDEILNDGSNVKLFTRPERFGKTLNMTMLKYFFDIKNAKENRELFKGLEIEKLEGFKEQGKYPTIYISFKNLDVNSWQEMIEKLRKNILDIFLEYKFLMEELDEFDLLRFQEYVNKEMEEIDFSWALYYLMGLLKKKYKKEVILIIDDYDIPLITAYRKKFQEYRKIKLFFDVFYGRLLKENNHLRTAIVTGKIGLVKNGDIPDINNVREYRVLDRQYIGFFGLMEKEVMESLEYFALKNKSEDVKEWYGGYRNKDTEIYNTWSVLNFLQTKELRTYYSENLDDGLVLEILDFIKQNKGKQDLEILFKDKSIKAWITGWERLSTLLDFLAITNLMWLTGYLVIAEEIEHDTFIFKFPNKEIEKLL